jgi:hypothetical protein
LGRAALLAFDHLIVAAMAVNTEVAKNTHGKSLTRLQRAACQVIPNGFSIALSIRELIRTGYLFSAEILLRPLVERVAVISHLMAAGDSALDLWEQGWPHKSRPSVKVMLGSIIEFDEFVRQFPEDPNVREYTNLMIDRFNALVHADPTGLDTNIGITPAGVIGYLSGANINDAGKCDFICHVVLIYVALLMKKAAEIFPDIKEPSGVLH